MGRKRKHHTNSDIQPSLFDLIREDEKNSSLNAAPASFNISCLLRNELSEGLKRCPLSRYEVAGRMSELLGVEVTKSQLDSWTAESKDLHRFPAEYLPAYCMVTGYKEPLRLMARLIKCYLLESEEALFAELGRIDKEKRDLVRKEKAVREFINTMKA